MWAVGEAYEAYVGRWSRHVADVFLDWLDRPARLRWLDVGCGTGALAGKVLSTADPTEVVGVDTAEGFLTTARSRLTDPRSVFRVGDARSLPFPDRCFDAVVSGLALNFVPEPGRAVAELVRVAGPGGVVAAYVWDYAEGMAMMRYFWDAAIALDPTAAALDEGPRFPTCRPDSLSRAVDGGGSGTGDGPGDRRADRVRRLRRLLATVPRRPGSGTGVRHVAVRGAPSGAS